PSPSSYPHLPLTRPPPPPPPLFPYTTLFRSLDAVDAQLTKAVMGFRQTFARVAPAFDYVVIDTPPTWSGRNYAALMIATTLIARSEEHTSELQSPCNLVCRLLLEKKKKTDIQRSGYLHNLTTPCMSPIGCFKMF